MRFVIVVLLAGLVVAPSVGASWRGVGTQEPDTLADLTGGFMFFDAPQRGAPAPSPLYFDVFPASPAGLVNPNVGALGSMVLAPGAVTFRALLGVWRDCNGDGYIGSAEAALQDYRSELLLNDTECPVGFGPGEIVHNDGQWVTEFLMLGSGDPCEFKDATYIADHCPGVSLFSRNARVIYVNGSRMWGDVGAPGAAPLDECPVTPLPRGTTSGTGALLRALDCHDGRRVAQTVNLADPSGERGLRFDDPSNPQASSSLLNQQFPVNLFGNPTTGAAGLLEKGSGEPAFEAWDCSRPRATELRDPTAAPGERGDLSVVTLQDPTGNQLTGTQGYPIVGKQTFFADHDQNAGTPGQREQALADGRGEYAWFPAPADVASSLRPTGSYWDAAEGAAEGPNEDCDPETANAVSGEDPFASVESGDLVTAGRRDRNSFVFRFYDGYRPLNARLDPLMGPEAPTDAGMTATRNHYGGAVWNADGYEVQRQAPIRADDLQPSGPQRFTFYASFIPPVDTVAPSTVVGTYGAEACQGSYGPGALPARGWVCDASKWWHDADGRDDMPRHAEGAPLGAVPGDTYRMRDVDCFDGTLVRGTPVKASLADGSAEGGCEQILR